MSTLHTFHPSPPQVVGAVAEVLQEVLGSLDPGHLRIVVNGNDGHRAPPEPPPPNASSPPPTGPAPTTDSEGSQEESVFSQQEKDGSSCSEQEESGSPKRWAAPSSGGPEGVMDTPCVRMGQEDEDGAGRLPPGPAEKVPDVGEPGPEVTRRYTRRAAELLLHNCLGLAASLLVLLGSGWARRDAAAKTLLGSSGDAAAIAVAAGAVLSQGLDRGRAVWVPDGGSRCWGLGVREGALAVLGNLALHERTAAVSAAVAASPELAMLALRAASSSSGNAGLLSASSIPGGRSRSRTVLGAPASLLVHAASLLCNHVRAAPRLLTLSAVLQAVRADNAPSSLVDILPTCDSDNQVGQGESSSLVALPLSDMKFLC